MENLVGELDVAILCVIAFVVFFLGLLCYLRQEDKRGGYPLERINTTGALDFRLPLVAAYFGALALWPISASLAAGAPAAEAMLGLFAPLPIALPTLALPAAR